MSLELTEGFFTKFWDSVEPVFGHSYKIIDRLLVLIMYIQISMQPHTSFILDLIFSFTLKTFVCQLLFRPIYTRIYD